MMNERTHRVKVQWTFKRENHEVGGRENDEQ